MRTKKTLAIENLESREVFTGMPGVEGFNIYDAPLNVTDQEIIDALNAGTQFTADHGVDSPRDAASAGFDGSDVGIDSFFCSDGGMADTTEALTSPRVPSEKRIELINGTISGFSTPDAQRVAAVDEVLASSTANLVGGHWID